MSRSSKYARCFREIVYGPIPSRRLGQSIGINLFPGERKICSFDCIYCFIKEDNPHAGITYAKKEDLINQLNTFFSSPENEDDIESAEYLTFSGNGEPTLHPEFNELVQTVSVWKQKFKSNLKLAIFTNSSQLSNPKIIESLALFDKIFCKFDWSSDNELQQISRPVINLKFDEIIKNLKNLISYVKSKNKKTEIILQTAIYDKNRSIENWKTWANYVKEISPDEVQLYEIDFTGPDYEPDKFFNYVSFQNSIIPLLREEAFDINFFFDGKFIIDINFCCAVDSLIYLPLYLADFDNLFDKKAVKVKHFVSPDGDPGAIKSIINGQSQFAICDPQAAIDYYVKNIDKNEVHSPKLIAVLINKVALWAVAETDQKTNLNEMIMPSSKIITYNDGSTANYIWNYQKKRNKDYSQKTPVYCSPGEEFSKFCSDISSQTLCVITADLLGADWCQNNCSKKKISVYPYSNTFNGHFLFSGIIASSEFINKYPGAVDSVIKAFEEAIYNINSKRYMNEKRIKFTQYLEKIFKNKNLWYIKKCHNKNQHLIASIDSAINQIIKLNIFSKSLKINFLDLWNALEVRSQNTCKDTNKAKMLSVRNINKWIDKRAITLKGRMLILLIRPLQKFILNEILKTFFVTLLLFIFAFVTWFESAKVKGGMSYFLLTVSGVLVSLAAASLAVCCLMILNRWRNDL